MMLGSQFPGLNPSNCNFTSPPDGFYNCIAWSVKENFRWLWPSDAFWPVPCDGLPTVENFIQMFSHYGYVIPTDATYSASLEKIAIYTLNGEVTHAARQLDELNWTSKLGQFIDLSHHLHALNGPTYGSPTHFLAKSI